jgi:hypothetical protein
MRKLAVSIAALGAAQVSLWAWAPPLLRWQTKNALEQYGALKSMDTILNTAHESMNNTYVESALVGALMLVASALMLLRLRTGWSLWLVCLALVTIGALVSIWSAGFTVGVTVRLVVLAAFIVGTVRARQGPPWSQWFKKDSVV